MVSWYIYIYMYVYPAKDIDTYAFNGNITIIIHVCISRQENTKKWFSE